MLFKRRSYLKQERTTALDLAQTCVCVCVCHLETTESALSTDMQHTMPHIHTHNHTKRSWPADVRQP